MAGMSVTFFFAIGPFVDEEGRMGVYFRVITSSRGWLNRPFID